MSSQQRPLFDSSIGKRSRISGDNDDATNTKKQKISSSEHTDKNAIICVPERAMTSLGTKYLARVLKEGFEYWEINENDCVQVRTFIGLVSSVFGAMKKVSVFIPSDELDHELFRVVVELPRTKDAIHPQQGMELYKLTCSPQHKLYNSVIKSSLSYGHGNVISIDISAYRRRKARRLVPKARKDNMSFWNYTSTSFFGALGSVMKGKDTTAASTHEKEKIVPLKSDITGTIVHLLKSCGVATDTCETMVREGKGGNISFMSSWGRRDSSISIKIWRHLLDSLLKTYGLAFLENVSTSFIFSWSKEMEKEHLWATKGIIHKFTPCFRLICDVKHMKISDD